MHSHCITHQTDRVATAQGKRGIWFLLFPDMENTRNFVWTVYLHTVSVYSCVIFIWDMKQTGVGEGCNFEVIIFH